LRKKKKSLDETYVIRLLTSRCFKESFNFKSSTFKCPFNPPSIKKLIFTL